MMLLKLALASIAFAAVAAQSDSEITAEIERLQLLMAAREQAARETRNADLNPSMVTEDGDLNVRLRRQNSAFRITRQTEVDVGALADRVGLLETATVPGVAANARTVAYEAAYHASLNASVTLIDRLNDRMDTMVSRMASISAEVSSQMSNLESTMVVRVNTANAQGAAQQTAIDAQQTAAMTALNTSMQRRLEVAVNATRALGSDTIYTHWGSKVCTAPNGFQVVKHYDGFTWGAHHDSNGGGVMLCLKNVAGDEGGIRTGGDSADIIIPVRVDHRSYVNNAVPDRPIPCARCMYSKTCYLEVGIDGCQAQGYALMYHGMLFGGHMGHRANNNRICVDTERDGDWTDGGNWGGYMYATIERANIQRRQNQKTVRCQWCCKP